ncbi:hypothetical protein CL629_00245 [bacterium]|nr:hypothetical protein [bacterium]|tara:strand:- start:4617 stop:5111 length:495 start_codon:yes stop_codon:yes gene_type:complete
MGSIWVTLSNLGIILPLHILLQRRGGKGFLNSWKIPRKILREFERERNNGTSQNGWLRNFLLKHELKALFIFGLVPAITWIGALRCAALPRTKAITLLIVGNILYVFLVTYFLGFLGKKVATATEGAFAQTLAYIFGTIEQIPGLIAEILLQRITFPPFPPYPF